MKKVFISVATLMFIVCCNTTAIIGYQMMLALCLVSMHQKDSGDYYLQTTFEPAALLPHANASFTLITTKSPASVWSH